MTVPPQTTIDTAYLYLRDNLCSVIVCHHRGDVFWRQITMPQCSSILLPLRLCQSMSPLFGIGCYRLMIWIDIQMIFHWNSITLISTPKCTDWLHKRVNTHCRRTVMSSISFFISCTFQWRFTNKCSNDTELSFHWWWSPYDDVLSLCFSVLWLLICGGMKWREWRRISTHFRRHFVPSFGWWWSAIETVAGLCPTPHVAWCFVVGASLPLCGWCLVYSFRCSLAYYNLCGVNRMNLKVIRWFII